MMIALGLGGIVLSRSGAGWDQPNNIINKQTFLKKYYLHRITRSLYSLFVYRIYQIGFSIYIQGYYRNFLDHDSGHWSFLTVLMENLNIP